MNILWPQCFQTGDQLQKKSRKNHKCVGIKEDATKEWLGQRRNKRDQKVHKTNENENIANQNYLITAKAVLREKFISLQAYLKRPEKSQLNNIILHFKELEKKEQLKPTSLQERNNKISRTKWNREQNYNRKKQCNKQLFFEKTNEIEKPLARLTKEKRKYKKKKSEMKEKLQQIPQK